MVKSKNETFPAGWNFGRGFRIVSFYLHLLQFSERDDTCKLNHFDMKYNSIYNFPRESAASPTEEEEEEKPSFIRRIQLK